LNPDHPIGSGQLLKRLFAQLQDTPAPLRSPLLAADQLAGSFGLGNQGDGRWLIKADHALPVAGSIKARGGFHEVIAVAERIALRHRLIHDNGDLVQLADPAAREVFSHHTVMVGSTGNLGMSIGLMSAALGFKAVVHMSREAKAWKKARLRAHGVVVVEHEGDYAAAVASGRQAAAADPLSHFVDDENSLDLFVGYAAAARELGEQLSQLDIAVDEQHPLFVYLPCGVGGAPGGITYGLKRLFGRHAHCFFAEPTQSPCMLAQLLSPEDKPVSVYDLGLTNRTEADGLAVAQASPLVAPLMRMRLDGAYTITDQELLALMRRAQETEGLRLEPSAAAGIAGPILVSRSADSLARLEALGLSASMPKASHVIWTTGGALLPDEQYRALMARAHRSAPRLEA